MVAMSGHSQRLRQALEQRAARGAVIGLGYVGLPLAVALGKAGFPVVGVDVDRERVARLKAGESPVEDVGSDELATLVASGRLKITTEPSALKDADAIIICVPTPLGKSREPDISYIVAAADAVAVVLRPGQLVVLESTTYPGTTEEVLLPRFTARGLRVGEEFFLAFSPERLDPGNKRFNTRNIPKVIGGATPACTRIAALLYSQTIERVIPVSSTRVAEMIKLLENTFRSVNIGLVNEIALMCDKMGIDVWEVIEGASSKPFGFTPFYPGPGLGGHCLPIDPLYLSWKAKGFGFEARFIELAARVNANMPDHVVTKIVAALNSRGKCVAGSKILILGVAYKRDVSDTRESPAIDIVSRLRRMGGIVSYHDPHVSAFCVEDRPLAALPLTQETLRDADCVVVVSDHSRFDIPMIHRFAELIVDTRNALKNIAHDREKIHKL